MRSRQMAATMMSHAYHRVSLGHKSKLGRWAKHKVGESWRTSSAAGRASTVVSVTAGASVIIASSILTAGLAPAVISSIAGGTYLVKKLVEVIGFQVGRLNRNWLNNYSRASSMDAGNYADRLGVEAKDAIRRAIDHYNTTRDILEKELKPLHNKEFTTCNDAINLAKATARFIHYSDKTRNYLLPCIDLALFMLLQYQELSQKWNWANRQFGEKFEKWFEFHDNFIPGHCSRDKSEPCYGPLSKSDVTPRKPHSSYTSMPSGSTSSSGVGSVSVGEESVEIMDLVNALAKLSVEGIERAMIRHGERPAPTRNFHSVMPDLSLHEQLQLGQGNEKRFKQLIEDAYASADRPGYLAQMGRRISHSYSSRTGGEIALGVISELVNMGNVATPFIPAPAVGEVLKVTINEGQLARGGIKSTSTLGNLLGKRLSFQSNSQEAIDSGLIDWKLIEHTTSDTMIAAGVKVEQLLVKAGTHFHEALEACKVIDNSSGLEISTCRDAWEFGKAMAEVVHHMKKMERYLMPALSLIYFISEETIKWSVHEAEIWQGMEDTVANWMTQQHVHFECINANSKCYGPKRTGHIRGGTLDNFLHQRRDYTINYDRPHKPL